MSIKIAITVNGVKHTNKVEPRLLLVYYLRDVLRLTGTHVGCDTQWLWRLHHSSEWQSNEELYNACRTGGQI
jgi:hypothetical protein